MLSSIPFHKDVPIPELCVLATMHASREHSVPTSIKATAFRCRRPCYYIPTSARSRVKHAICALFAASATKLKSFKNGAVSGVPPPSPL